MRIGIKFERKGLHTMYVSHLDMQRLFARAFRRAGVPVIYSQGFNPHINMSFASALPVSMETLGDYLEVAAHMFEGEAEFISALNNALPDGIRVTAAGRIPDGTPKLMAALEYAEYKITGSPESLMAIEKICDSDSFFVDKKTKGGIKPVDIRPMIYSYNILGDTAVIKLKLSGSGSLSPAVLTNAAKIIEPLFDAEFVRTELYTDLKGIQTPLSALFAR